jgi:superoxide reductase
MKERQQIYRCEMCGNMVELIEVGGGELVCCGQPMKLFAENTTDAATEKHVPVVEKVDGGYKVSVGEVDHPMEEKHFIQWIELLDGDKVYRVHLKPGDKPVAFFPVQADSVVAREFCNLHGLWKG